MKRDLSKFFCKMSRVWNQGIVLLIAGVLCPLASHAWTAAEVAGMNLPPHPGGRYRPDRLLVQFTRDADPADIQALHQTLGTRRLKAFPHLDQLEVVSVPDGIELEALIGRYQGSEWVMRAEPDYWLRPAVVPNDPAFVRRTLWALHNTGQSGGLADADVDAPEAWDAQREANDLIVAIVDSGIRYTHEDLAANLWVNPREVPGNGTDDDLNGYVDDIHGINTIEDNGDPHDDAGHGTLIAGIIGAVGNNGKGVVGTAWRIRLLGCKFFDGEENGSVSDAIECIDYARRQGARVINASWGSTNSSWALQTSIRSARDAGIILVAAAGNGGSDTDAVAFYPACFPLDNIVSVAATTRTDALASYSNFGASTVDLAAPGSSIYSTHYSSDTSYAYTDGTSAAAPYVTGACALVLARYPAQTYRQVIRRVLDGVDPVSGLAGKCATGGRLNLSQALGPSVLAGFTANPEAGEPPLSVRFTDTSFGDVVGWHWDFGDASNPSAERHPEHIYAEPGEFTVTLTVTGESGATASTNCVLPVVIHYDMALSSFAWLDPARLPPLALADDGVSAALPLPFAFEFYGEPYSNLYVGANGLVGFSPEGLSVAANTDMPQATAPNGVLCPWWDDLNPAASGAVRAGSLGAAPNREFVVSWNDVVQSSIPPFLVTFQVVLEEGSNVICFQYLDVGESMRYGAGRTATVGLEHRSGKVARKFSYNGSSLLSNGQAVRFVPRAPTALSVDLTEDGLRLEIAGQPGQSCWIEVSADLRSWSPLGPGIFPPSGVLGVVVPLPTEAGAQFYRARFTP